MGGDEGDEDGTENDSERGESNGNGAGRVTKDGASGDGGVGFAAGNLDWEEVDLDGEGLFNVVDIFLGLTWISSRIFNHTDRSPARAMVLASKTGVMGKE